MMSTYQNFHESIVKAIERGDAEAMTLLRDGLIDAVYARIPRYNMDKFRLWVMFTVLSNPLRRHKGQYSFVAIVRAQDRGEFDSLTSKVLTIFGDCAEMDERTHDPKNLLEDPDDLYFFRHHNGIKNVGVSDVKGADGTCLICTEAFDDTQHAAQQGPCGHIVSKNCFEKWLFESSMTYTCPLCRVCVICGANPCANHKIKTERVQPASLSGCLDTIFPKNAGKLLNGILPVWYWHLREITLPDRVILAYINSGLANVVDAADPVVVSMTNTRGQLFVKVKSQADMMLLRSAANRSPLNEHVQFRKGKW
ncbi:hypothetical protein DE146DRAFT_766966 [Phaeosphaeria sp. MPI-PUGE-AT-0046c]|nr:hypothetical protein DE146DRAFT_766966 [Phaeosphaeria sp. MPI-PUGE-AT-0046c]